MAKEVLRWPIVIYFGTLQSCHRAIKTALSQVVAKGTMSWQKSRVMSDELIKPQIRKSISTNLIRNIIV